VKISGARHLERFPAKWIPVRVKKTRQNKEIEPPFRFNRNGKGSSPALFFLPDAGVGDRLTLAIDLHDTIPAATA